MDKSKLERYAEIQAMVQKEARDIAVQVYQEMGTQYAVPVVPFHVHNGIDASTIPGESLDIVEVLPSNMHGVLSQIVLGNQTVDNPAAEGFGDPATSPVVPIPVIYGYGTTSSITMTGSPSTGAVSATLTGNWPNPTTTLAVAFTSNEIRNVRFTSGSAAIFWVEPLTTGAGGTGATIIDNSRFKGGDAPYGTVIGFRNDDDNIYQIWVKTISGVTSGTWIGFDADYTILGYD